MAAILNGLRHSLETPAEPFFAIQLGPGASGTAPIKEIKSVTNSLVLVSGIARVSYAFCNRHVEAAADWDPIG